MIALNNNDINLCVANRTKVDGINKFVIISDEDITRFMLENNTIEIKPDDEEDNSEIVKLENYLVEQVSAFPLQHQTKIVFVEGGVV